MTDFLLSFVLIVYCRTVEMEIKESPGDLTGGLRMMDFAADPERAPRTVVLL